MRFPQRVEGALVLGDVGARDLAAAFGTPLLGVELDVLRSRVDALLAACAPHGIGAAYAAKALPLPGVIRRICERGLDADVCSVGELAAAERAGLASQRIVLHGSGKGEAELRAACEGRAGAIVVDDVHELRRLAQIAVPARPVDVLLRMNTGIEAHTHAFVLTGGDDSKFGIQPRDAAAARAVLKQAPNLRFAGLHAHVGSQIADDRAFVANAEALLDLAAEFAHDGLPVERLIVGGGFGIAMQPGADDEEIDVAATMAAIARVVSGGARARGLAPPAVSIEPGRTLIGPAGTTLYTVNAIKRQTTRTFVVVDGGLFENPRPALYGSYHVVAPALREVADDAYDATICGRSCENDELGPARVPSDLAEGELLAQFTTGAYTYAMASNYNRLARPAVVGVAGGKTVVLARRETVEDVLLTDTGL